MPTAICNNGHLTYWRNQRGARLADLRCSCGRAVQAATYDSATETWKPRESRKGKRGSIGACAICGRQAYLSSGSADVLVRIDLDGMFGGRHIKFILEADDAICSIHSFLRAERWRRLSIYPWDFDIETADWLQDRGINYDFPPEETR